MSSRLECRLRAVADAALYERILALRDEMFNALLGSRKTWRLLHAQQGVSALVPLLGRSTHVSHGTLRCRAGKVDSDREAEDLLRREFTADRPKRRWAVGFFYVQTRSGL